MLVVGEDACFLGAVMSDRPYRPNEMTDDAPARILLGSKTLTSPVSIPAAITPFFLSAIGADQAKRLNLSN